MSIPSLKPANAIPILARAFAVVEALLTCDPSISDIATANIPNCLPIWPKPVRPFSPKIFCQVPPVLGKDFAELAMPAITSPII